METPIYNTIGSTYNSTRRADPYITSRMTALLQPNAHELYLDLGCGTGNYLRAMLNQGFRFYGVDPSDTMLARARENCAGTTILQGVAEAIPFDEAFFDGAMVMFTLHHWTDQQQGIRELGRVIKPGGRLVLLSFSAEQMDQYWLNHYFPEMIYRSGRLVPDVAGMIAMFEQAGFTAVETENYFIREDLEDHFLYSNKYRPEQYLNPEVRAGISSFAAFSTPDEVEQGLQRLEADIRSGAITEIIQLYENTLGDYIFYSAVRK